MKKIIYFISVYVLLLASCKNNRDAGYVETDTPKKGTIYISVDESFKPVIEQQIKVYHSSYPEANIIASYKPEVECFKDLMKDSTRLIIVAKGLTKNETSFFENKLSVPPQFAVLAYDAVAVITNINSKDSVFTIADLKNILTGKKNKTVIMDGNNATSSVRYLQDSVLRGASFGKNVVAVNGSAAVIEAIKKTENAIGFVGSSWVGNSDEPQQVEDLKKMRLALIQCVKCNEKDMFAKPSQSTVTFGEYPLVRPLYYIFKDDAGGLGTAFVNFMSLERGQLIFRRSGLAPAKMGFLIRNSKIKEQE
ncbi:PBP superfamily domain protein [mine drainage metagenome]|uniref:PBP superfamily domain protein n=1 Tax=mine drainage metagenome TaxID=410659 RepID=A0A1J5SUG9_9ZZZZ